MPLFPSIKKSFIKKFHNKFSAWSPKKFHEYLYIFCFHRIYTIFLFTVTSYRVYVPYLCKLCYVWLWIIKAHWNKILEFFFLLNNKLTAEICILWVKNKAISIYSFGDENLLHHCMIDINLIKTDEKLHFQLYSFLIKFNDHSDIIKFRSNSQVCYKLLLICTFLDIRKSRIINWLNWFLERWTRQNGGDEKPLIFMYFIVDFPPITFHLLQIRFTPYYSIFFFLN